MGNWTVCAKSSAVSPSPKNQTFVYATSPSFQEPISESHISDCVSLNNVSDYYTFTKVLGYGHFGVVRESIMTQSKGFNTYAIKSIPKESWNGNFIQLKRELKVLYTLDHPNIIKLYELFEDAKYLHMVMETCYGGSLFDWIIKRAGLPEGEARPLFKQICSAVGHIHASNIVHRDLKPDNLLLASQNSDSVVKIIDFGLSQQYRLSHMDSVVGSPSYMAPEVIEGKYGKECDIWSLGIILYAMLSAWLPFDAPSLPELFQLIKKGEYNITYGAWDQISQNAKDLVSQMIVVDRAERMTIQEVLKHPWFHSKTQPLGWPTARTILPTISKILELSPPERLNTELQKILVQHMTADNFDGLIKTFQSIDTEHTGYISVKNLKKAMTESGLNSAGEELKRKIDKTQISKRRKINYTTFLTATIDLKAKLSEHLLFETFSHFDVHREGYITLGALRLALQRYNIVATKEEVRNLFKEYDLEDTGKIDYEGFKRMMFYDSSDSKTAYPRAFDSFMGFENSSNNIPDIGAFESIACSLKE